jgi:plasmid segregation protein ParM
VCSIPVQEYADGRADEIKANISGAYVIDSVDGSIMLNINVKPENVVIVPEGAGSYFQAIHNDPTLAGREVAVIDIGFYTTDLVIFNKGNYVTGSARSAKIGARHVAEAVYSHLRKNARFEGDLWSVDSELENGCINIGTKCVGFTEQRDSAYADLLDDVIAFYRSSKGSRTPGAVVLSGGGAQQAYKFLPDALKADGWLTGSNPRRANADGAFIFLEKRQQKAKTNG